MLRPSIELPRVFESSDPRLIYGFVTLVKVFAAVDNKFLSVWREDQPGGRHHARDVTTPSLTQLLSYNDDVPGALSMSEMDETQRLDILVTRQWLRALVWRLQLRHGVRSLSSSSSNENQPLLLQHKEDAHHPFQTSRSVLGIISAANRIALEAHGIGMVTLPCCEQNEISHAHDPARNKRSSTSQAACAIPCRTRWLTWRPGTSSPAKTSSTTS